MKNIEQLIVWAKEEHARYNESACRSDVSEILADFIGNELLPKLEEIFYTSTNSSKPK